MIGTGLTEEVYTTAQSLASLPGRNIVTHHVMTFQLEIDCTHDGGPKKWNGGEKFLPPSNVVVQHIT